MLVMMVFSWVKVKSNILFGEVTGNLYWFTKVDNFGIDANLVVHALVS